jgi:hypothetical protein
MKDKRLPLPYHTIFLTLLGGLDFRQNENNFVYSLKQICYYARKINR